MTTSPAPCSPLRGGEKTGTHSVSKRFQRRSQDDWLINYGKKEEVQSEKREGLRKSLTMPSPVQTRKKKRENKRTAIGPNNLRINSTFSCVPCHGMAWLPDRCCRKTIAFARYIFTHARMYGNKEKNRIKKSNHLNATTVRGEWCRISSRFPFPDAQGTTSNGRSLN